MIKKYSKFIYIILIFYLFWLALIPLACNHIFNAIIPQILEKSGINLEIENFRIRTSILPHITIKAENISLLNKDNSTALNINHSKLSVKILPLLTGKLYINGYSANFIKANFKLTDKLYLGDYELPKPQTDFDPSKFDLNKFRIYNLNLKKYEINLTENNHTTKFYGDNLKLKNTKRKIVFRSNSKINNTCELKFDLNLPKTKKQNKSKCNIVIKNLDLSEFSSLLTYFDNNIQSARGKINILSKKNKMNTQINELKVVYKTKSESIIFPKKLNIDTKFYIYNNTLDIKESIVKAQGIHANISGKIKNIFTLNPKFDLETEIKHIDLRIGALMLPNIVTEDISTPALKKYAFYGDISGKLNIIGALPKPDIKGRLYIPNGMMIKPIKNAKGKAKIGLNFIGQKVVIDVDVPVNFNEWVKVDGDIALYDDKYANLNIHSSNNVDLDTAEFVLNPLHEIFKFEIGPVPIMDISGSGSANLKIIGTKKDAHAWGNFKFHNTNARFLEVNGLVLKNANGYLNFDDRIAYFINKTGTVNGKPATIEGRCSLFGDFDFNVTAKNQKLSDLVTILTTSPMLKPMQNMVPPIKNIKGNSDFLLNLKGEKVLHIADLKINENVIAKGSIKLLGNSFVYENLPLKNVKGLINFHKTDCDIDLKGKLSTNSNITIKGSLKDNLADIKIFTPKIIVNELNIKELKVLDTLAIKLDAKYKGKIDQIEIGGINASINVLKNNAPVKNCKVSTGQIILKHSNLKFHNISGFVKHNPFYINANIKNIGKTTLNLNKAKIDGSFRCKNFDLTVLNSLKNLYTFPTELEQIIKNINIVQGHTDINVVAKNNNINSVINLNNTNFTYSIIEGTRHEKVDIPVRLINGQIILKDNTITLKKLNCLIDEMPILIFGKINNIYKNPKYNIYINSKLVQKVFTKYWNAYSIYPVKVSGDIVSTVRAIGDKKHTHIVSESRMEENSEIYYMGAILGDSLDPITFKVDTDIYSNGEVKINKISYNKIISSQNNKQNEFPLLSISGDVKKSGNNYLYKNIRIKSENPADARLFNIIFKKPTIKQGTFLSDLIINGSLYNPKILGKFNLTNVEMPYLNTTIKEVALNFKPDTINVLSKGEVLSNYIMGSAEIENKLKAPYTVNKAYIYINNLDINHVISQLKQLELKGISSAISTGKDMQSLSAVNLLKIKNAKIRAGQIVVKNISASNLEATCEFNDKKISVDSFNFNLAEGIISGNLKFNLKNNFMNLNLSANKVNANSLTTALFDLPNQIYGDLTGNIEISCDTTNEKTQYETFSGSGQFNVTNGKMPKLGSLEYLLKAGNLLRGGITSISMNSIIDIITPLKTGEFSSIHGHFHIKNGIARTIEIHSHGKNLNLYIAGKYNFIDSVADMNVYGQLSRKVSTVLGAAGNISLNTLFNKIPGVSTSQFINEINKIPGIDLSNKSNRKFIVEILGDINGDDFVKSFKWLN